MTKEIIAFQGEKGAYSHLACEETFPNATIKTCATFEETFKMAFENENLKIMVPIENSLAGRVADIHHLLTKYKLQIYSEHFQKVEHNLLANIGTELKDIKYVNLKRSKLELERDLEQMRALENNMKIHVGLVNSIPLSVDTEEDLQEIKKNMENK